MNASSSIRTIHSLNHGSNLVIDFGDTNSVICLCKYNLLEVLNDCTESGVTEFPSLVEYRGNEILTATAAKRRRGRGMAKYCVSCVGRLLGLTWDEYQLLEKKDVFGVEVVCGSDGYPRFVVSDEGRQVTCIEVASELFRKFKSDASAWNGAPIDDCYVVIPVTYKDAQQIAIKEAARIAGLKVKSFILKPVAVAMSWYSDHKYELTRNDKVLVFDFGKSSLDLSLLMYDENGYFLVMDTDGDPNMGGDDVDYEIAKEVCKIVEDMEGIPFNPLKTRRRARFLAVCEEAKKELYPQLRTSIDVSEFNPDIDTEIPFAREQLNDIVNRMFMSKINSCIDRMTNKPDRTCEVIKRVFMVGESSCLLAVREAVKKRFFNAGFSDIGPHGVFSWVKYFS